MMPHPSQSGYLNATSRARTQRGLSRPGTRPSRGFRCVSTSRLGSPVHGQQQIIGQESNFAYPLPGYPVGYANPNINQYPSSYETDQYSTTARFVEQLQSLHNQQQTIHNQQKSLYHIYSLAHNAPPTTMPNKPVAMMSTSTQTSRSLDGDNPTADIATSAQHAQEKPHHDSSEQRVEKQTNNHEEKWANTPNTQDHGFSVGQTSHVPYQHYDQDKRVHCSNCSCFHEPRKALGGENQLVEGRNHNSPMSHQIRAIDTEQDSQDVYNDDEEAESIQEQNVPPNTPDDQRGFSLSDTARFVDWVQEMFRRQSNEEAGSFQNEKVYEVVLATPHSAADPWPAKRRGRSRSFDERELECMKTVDLWPVDHDQQMMEWLIGLGLNEETFRESLKLGTRDYFQEYDDMWARRQSLKRRESVG